MKKGKFVWLAVSVTLVVLIAIGAYYVFGGKDNRQEAEQYWWQKDPEIVRVSEKFKSIDHVAILNYEEGADRRMEGSLLFPVITIGSSTTEVRALLGKPHIQAHIRLKRLSWNYLLYHDLQVIDLAISDKGIVIDKGGLSSHDCGGGGSEGGDKDD